jgi:hypothetical protein
MPWQLISRYSVQVGQTVETPIMKLYGDPPGLRLLPWMSFNCGDCMSCLLPVENLPPPITIGGGDTSMASEALVRRDADIHRPSR